MISPWDCRRILAIDDSATNLEQLTAVLSSGGLAEVRCVSDPSTALEAFRQLRPDMVVLTLHMEGVDGFEVLAQIHDILDDDDYVPVIVITADRSVESRDQAWAAGADDFLTMPLDRAEVILRVRNLLRTRTLHTRLRQDNRDLARRLRLHEDRRRWLVEERRTREERIEGLLTGKQLSMAFQPVVELRTGATIGAEAVACFATVPQRSPDVWFAEAKEVGLGAVLESAAISAAVGQIDDLPDGSFLTVNVSPEVVESQEFRAAIRGAPLDRVVLEVTEHARVDDYESLLRALAPLRAGGVRLAVDDAGAGFSSFRHILRLSPDLIKLDIEITHDIDSDPVRQALAGALVTFGITMGATIVAEGIETEAELTAVRDLGIDWGQGFLLGRPAPLSLRATRDDRWVGTDEPSVTVD